MDLQENGRRIMVCCPFHGERQPSFCLYPDNTYKCFGCGKYGKGAIDFVMGLDSTFQEAIDYLEKL